MTEAEDAIRRTLNRSVAAGTARITCVVEMSWALPPFPKRRDRGPVRRAAVGTLKRVGKGACRLATRRTDPRHQTAEGVIDFVGRRYMIDHGSFAVLQMGAQEWSGRSGRAVDTLTISAAHVGSPLWLVDLLAGVTTAEEHGSDPVPGSEVTDGQPWRHFTATANLADASAATPEGMPSPAQDRFEDLLTLPIEVWVDDLHVRRVRFSSGHRTDTLTLTDFGVDTRNLDWTRLPTFRTGD